MLEKTSQNLQWEGLGTRLAQVHITESGLKHQEFLAAQC